MKYVTTLLIGLLVLMGAEMSAQKQSCDSDKSTKGFLGIQSSGISKAKAKALSFGNIHGNYVSNVLPGTAAEDVGIQPLDYIYGINDDRATEKENMEDLLNKYSAGEEIDIYLIRQGKPKTVPVTLGKNSDIEEKHRSSKEDPFFGINRHPQNDDAEVGVKVTVVNNSTAKEMGLQNGDLITSINGNCMVDWSDISVAIDAMEVGEEISVEYVRDGKKAKEKMPIRSYSTTYPKQKEATVTEYKPVESAFLGIQSADMSLEKARILGFDNPYGSYVSKVIPNTSAEKAGVQVFDYIYGIDEHRTGEHQSLGSIIRKHEPGTNVKLYLVRKDKKTTLPATLGRRSDSRERTVGECEDPFLGIRHNHKVSNDKGIGVDIVKNSTAESIGMQNGDIILTLNEYRMIDWSDISIAIDNMKVGEPINVVYLRDGNKKTAEGPIRSHCDTYKKEWEEKMHESFSFRGMDAEEAEEAEDYEDLDLRSVAVRLQDLSHTEAEEINRKYNLKIAKYNTLKVESLRLFPKSTSGKFNLQFDLPNSGATSVKIYNSTGRTIYDYDLGNFSGSFNDNVDIAQNGAGKYYLEIRQNGKSKAQKIVLH